MRVHQNEDEDNDYKENEETIREIYGLYYYTLFDNFITKKLYHLMWKNSLLENFT